MCSGHRKQVQGRGKDGQDEFRLGFASVYILKWYEWVSTIIMHIVISIIILESREQAECTRFI